MFTGLYSVLPRLNVSQYYCLLDSHRAPWIFSVANQLKQGYECLVYYPKKPFGKCKTLGA